MAIHVNKDDSVLRTSPLTVGYARGISAYKERIKSSNGKIVRTQIEHRNGLVFMRAKKRIVYTLEQPEGS